MNSLSLIDPNIYGYVYLIKNKINGKTYVGQRKLSKDRDWHSYWGSGKLIINAINKYGIDNFSKTLVAVAYSVDDLTMIESKKIKEMSKLGKCEYNIAVFTPPPTTWSKMSDEAKRSCIKKIVASNKSRKGIEYSYNKFLSSTSASDRGKIMETYNETMSINKTFMEFGRSYSRNNIRRLLISEGVVLNYRNKKGIKHRDETKEKIASSIRANFSHKDKECALKGCNSIHRNYMFCSNSCQIKSTMSENTIPENELIEMKAKRDLGQSFVSLQKDYGYERRAISRALKSKFPISSVVEQ